jgi:hypothetical protein
MISGPQGQNLVGLGGGEVVWVAGPSASIAYPRPRVTRGPVSTIYSCSRNGQMFSWLHFNDCVKLSPPYRKQYFSPNLYGTRWKDNWIVLVSIPYQFSSFTATWAHVLRAPQSCCMIWGSLHTYKFRKTDKIDTNVSKFVSYSRWINKYKFIFCLKCLYYTIKTTWY